MIKEFFFRKTISNNNNTNVLYKNTNSITFFEHKMLEPFPMEAINAKTHFTLSVSAGCQEIKPLLQGSQTRGPPDAFVRHANIPKNDKIKNFDQI